MTIEALVFFAQIASVPFRMFKVRVEHLMSYSNDYIGTKSFELRDIEGALRTIYFKMVNDNNIEG